MALPSSPRRQHSRLFSLAGQDQDAFCIAVSVSVSVAAHLRRLVIVIVISGYNISYRYDIVSSVIELDIT